MGYIFIYAWIKLGYANKWLHLNMHRSRWFGLPPSTPSCTSLYWQRIHHHITPPCRKTNLVQSVPTPPWMKYLCIYTYIQPQSNSSTRPLGYISYIKLSSLLISRLSKLSGCVQLLRIQAAINVIFYLLPQLLPLTLPESVAKNNNF